jgi:hypothetical protein
MMLLVDDIGKSVDQKDTLITKGNLNSFSFIIIMVELMIIYY